MYNWPLNTNNFSFWERLKIASFIVSPTNIWTQGESVSRFEDEMARFVGCRHAVFCSSGSTANTILAMFLKHNQKDNKVNKVIFPSTTWTTSVSPFVLAGFEPVFLDINLNNLSIDLDLVDEYLKKHKDVALVFVTSLLGLVPDIAKIKILKIKYPDVEFWMDNCENTFGKYKGRNINGLGINCTTSTYFGHQIQSVEGGFVFTNDDNLYNYALMARNHGMVRSLPDQKRGDFLNDEVDSRFDFYLLGNNFRNTNINAFIGLLDFGKRYKNIKHRLNVAKSFYHKLSADWLKFPEKDEEHVMFCLPVIYDGFGDSKNKIKKVKTVCDSLKIETRPIISGNLLKQTCYSKYSSGDYPNSDLVHNNGIYVGLHLGVTEEMVESLARQINYV